MLTISEALAQATRQDYELAPYYEFHRQLFDLQDKHAKTITATLEMADPQALQGRVFRGLPLVAFAQLPIDANHFGELALAIAGVIANYDPSLKEQPLPANADDWLALAERRFEENRANINRQSAEARSTSLAEMAVDMALKPYLAWAAEQAMPHLNQQEWKRPYCPVCGGAPDFALLEEEMGARQLVCSRCTSRWLYRRVGCPFCGTDDPAKIVYYPSNDEAYRLYVCQACRRYLKTKDLRKGGGPLGDVLVERVTTIAMDAAAQQEGYW